MTPPFRYLPEEDVVFVDMTGLAQTPQGVHDLIDGLIRIADGLSHETYLLASWGGWEPKPELFEVYALRAQELAGKFKGIVRYGLRDLRSRVRVRNLYVQQRDPKGAQIVETREEALRIIAEKRALEALQG